MFHRAALFATVPLHALNAVRRPTGFLNKTIVFFIPSLLFLFIQHFLFLFVELLIEEIAQTNLKV